MLDAFLAMHNRLEFADRWKPPLTNVAFDAFRHFACKDIQPPERSLLLRDGSPFRTHEMVYALLVEDELAMEAPLQKRLERMLAEVAILYRVLSAEKDLSDGTQGHNRSMTVLGWMVQERLVHLMLQTSPTQYEQILELGRVEGMDRDAWETRFTGACAEAKAIQELSLAGEMTLYGPTLYEDIAWGIDLLVELPGTRVGACVSVKRAHDTVTRFAMQYEPTWDKKQKEEWQRIEEGTQSFNGKTRRFWLPAIVRIAKENGKPIDLTMNGRAEEWARRIKAALMVDAQT